MGDPLLEVVSFIVGETGRLTTDPSMRELMQRPDELMFVNNALREKEQRRKEEAGRVLGTFWDLETLHRYAGTLPTEKGPKPAAEDFEKGIWVAPLTVLLAQHDWMKGIAKTLPVPGVTRARGTHKVAGETYHEAPNEQLISAADMSKEAFLDLMRRAACIYRRLLTAQT